MLVAIGVLLVTGFWGQMIAHLQTWVSGFGVVI
jgi:cytochrome c-type biogenesis protein